MHNILRFYSIQIHPRAITKLCPELTKLALNMDITLFGMITIDAFEITSSSYYIWSFLQSSPWELPYIYLLQL